MRKIIIASVIGVSILFLAGCSNSNQSQLPLSQKEASYMDLQSKCADMAGKFFSSKGYKSSEGFDYKNHYNSKQNKCFILISYGDINTNSIALDLYDALEGKHYAEFYGHAPALCIFDANKCKLDVGNIWYDGNDTRNPDVQIGFQGLMNGGGTGDKDTETQFMDKIQPFMND